MNHGIHKHDECTQELNIMIPVLMMFGEKEYLFFHVLIEIFQN